MGLRAKMRCTSVTSHDAGAGQVNELVTLIAVSKDGSEDNKTWAKFTPSGTLALTITNPEAQARMKPGREYYVDLEEVAAAEATTKPDP